MKKLLIVTVFTIATYSCFASGSLLLKGKIGDTALVMLIYYDDTSCSGKYFSSNHLMDITFVGSHNDSGMLFQIFAQTPNEKGLDTIRTIYLSPAQNHNWIGRSVSKTGQVSHIALKAEPVAGEQCSTGYSAARKTFIRPVKKETIHKEKITYTHYEIENTGVSYLQISAGLSAAAAKKINMALMNMGLEYADEYYSCSYGYANTDYGFSIDNEYLTDHVISIAVSGSYYCSNASIEDWHANYNYNAVTGERLRLEDVIYLGDSPSEKGGDQYPSETYAQKLVQLLTTLYPQQMLAQQEEGKCDYSATDLWQFGSWYFLPTGIFIQPDFRHFEMECGEERWSLIPYATARKYKKTSGSVMLPQ